MTATTRRAQTAGQRHAIDDAVAVGPVATNVGQVDGVGDGDVAIHALRLEQRADREDVHMSDIVRKALRTYLA